MTTDTSFTAAFRMAAVCLDLALSQDERERIVGRVKEGSPGIRAQSVCALIGMGLNHDDALAWTEPVLDDEPGFEEAWERAALVWLPDGEDSAAWRSVAVLGAAYLHGRQPQAVEVLAVGARAAREGYPRRGSQEGQCLMAAYDRYAGQTAPGGMWTVASTRPSQGFAAAQVALRIVSDALGRPVPQAGLFVTGLVTSAPGREEVTVTADPAQALWFPGAGKAHAYWTQQHGLRPWDGEPNRPLTAYTVEFVQRLQA